MSCCDHAALEEAQLVVLVLLAQGQPEISCTMRAKGHRFLSYFQERCIFIEKGGTHEPCEEVYRISAPFERDLCG
jgi:hypothetical protein